MEAVVPAPTQSDLGMAVTRAEPAEPELPNNFARCPTEMLESIRDNFTDRIVVSLFNEVIRLRGRVDELLDANNGLVQARRDSQTRLAELEGLLRMINTRVEPLVESLKDLQLSIAAPS